MKRILHEAGVITHNPATSTFRVRLINEGKGSSATYPREFFNETNAQRLASSMSFPGHPLNLEAPEQRDPMSAIGYIGETVTIEQDPADGTLGFWSEYHVAQSRPEVGPYLAEFADKLGLSIYSEGDGREDPATGEWFAESLVEHDPYRSVDVVVAAGRGGKIDRVVEGLRRITEASAPAGEKEVPPMEIKEVGDLVANLTTLVEGLVNTLTAKATADVQAEVDATAVNAIVESRLSAFDKAVVLISEAKLTESQAAELRAAAMRGEDVAPLVESAKKILTEARALAENDAEPHLGSGDGKSAVSFDVPGFGRVS